MKWTCKGLTLFNNMLLIPFKGGLIDAETIYDISITKHRKRRSLDANAYAWVLLDKLAAVLNTDKISIYKQCIKDVGRYQIFPIKNEDIDRFIKDWESLGIGWQTEILGTCKTTESYTNIIAYYGTSTYNSKEMARLIDWIVEECKEQEIETKQESEIKQLLSEWE